MLVITVATLHYLALAIGSAGLLIRFRALKACQKNGDLRELYFGDNLWGVAALLWISTGLMRAFGDLEKGTEFYLQNGWFLIKMGLFLGVFIVELYPMIVLVRWRFQKKFQAEAADAPLLNRLWVLNLIEIILLILIIGAASSMARKFF